MCSLTRKLQCHSSWGTTGSFPQITAGGDPTKRTQMQVKLDDREDACQSSLGNCGLPRGDEPGPACENVRIRNPHTNKNNALYSTEATFSPCKHLPSFFKEPCHLRPSYSPGFVLGGTIFMWSKDCTLICCWGWETQSPGKAQGTALQEAWEELTFQSKGEGEVAEDCQGCFTMRHSLYPPVKFTKKKEKAVETGSFMPLCKLVKRMNFAFFWRMVASEDSSCRRRASVSAEGANPSVCRLGQEELRLRQTGISGLSIGLWGPRSRLLILNYTLHQQSSSPLFKSLLDGEVHMLISSSVSLYFFHVICS